MESPTLLSPKPTKDYRASVDSSRPFRSVKEAVAIFGERILVGEIFSPKPYYTPPQHLTHENDHQTSWTPTHFSSAAPSPVNLYKEYDDNNNNNEFLDSLKKLEAELEDTKAELKILKERESETEIAVASLNAELHKNMSKLAEAEAAEAAKKAAAVAVTRKVSFDTEKKENVIMKEKEKKKEFMIRMENSPNLAQILSLGEEKGYFGGKKERKIMKKKPIVPLVGDFLFFRKKGSSNKTLNNPLYASTNGVF